MEEEAMVGLALLGQRETIVYVITALFTLQHDGIQRRMNTCHNNGILIALIIAFHTGLQRVFTQRRYERCPEWLKLVGFGEAASIAISWKYFTHFKL